MSVIKMVVFDMAGTTIDENNIVYKTIQAVLKNAGYDIDLDLVLLHGAGKEKWQAIHDILSAKEGGLAPEMEVTRLYHEFQVKLQAAYQDCQMQLFAAVPPVIKYLREKDIRVVFNTGYSRSVAEKILSDTDCQIGRDIDALITSSDVLHSRPAPDMIWKACEIWDCKPNQTIKVGDSIIDIEEGKNAGVKYSIGITTGAQSRQILEQANPDFIIDDMSELLTMVLL